MKVGDYVRTKYGIAKIEEVNTDDKHKTIWLIVDKAQYHTFVIKKQDIIKSSPNIIDLIEVGDYVNGQKVFDKLYDEGNVCWYLKLEIGEVFGKYARTYEQHIKSIITKEQFEAMEYKCE